jgi:iron(III) transport system ATP-binding protein
VALARAIITRPDILLFDEPLSNLDAKLRERVRIEIRALQRRLGITSLYVTHDQAEALAISDRIVVMNNGRIEQIGEPGAIYREPATSFVADFLGLANIIEGESLGDGEAQTAVGRLRVATALPPAGHPVRLSWRPEDMKLPADGLANRLRGRIATLVFRGSCIEVELVIAGHSIRAQVDNALHLREGETIDLGLAPDRIRMVS